ncbi:MAG: nuclear transport factor 2 family protein [Planctomycetia bacterium]|nr:nuclear transport factor 2 family protein [Planctomycetia bacterium]
MNRLRIFVLAGLVVLLGLGWMEAQDKTAAKRDADKLAIDQLAKELMQAFEKRDAAAVAAHWTAEGEFIRNDGEPIRGRAEIQKAYADYFKQLAGKPKLEVQKDGLRFPSQDTAVAEVTLRLKDEEGEVIASSWRNMLLVREGGQWKIAIVREWDRAVGQDVSLKQLEWLIGSWHVASKDREVTTTYEWDEHKVFIRGKFTAKEAGKVVESGTQMIGKDNLDGVIRSWVFQSDGGFGGGVWTRDGKKWTVDVHGVTPDGKELTGSSVYVHVDANTYTWQAVNRTLDGEPLPDTQPIKVTKLKAGK